MIGATATGPYRDLRVVEMGHALAGPLACTLMGDFGADVIKVERPGVGDSLRAMGPKHDGTGVWWSVTGRNKRSICIDFKQPAGVDLIMSILDGADILVENYRPGVLDRAGLSWEALSERCPRLIMLRISGFGQTGPYRDRGGFGKIAEAFSGATHLTGADDAPPVHPGYSLGDATTGLMGAFGLATALFERERSGRGQLIDLALYEPLLRLIEWQLPLQALTGTTAMRNGPRFPFDGAFITDICATADGESVIVSAATTDSVGRLRDFVAGEGLLDPASTGEAPIVDALRVWVAQHTRDDAIVRLEAAGVVVGGVLTAADLLDDPHVAARENIAYPQDAAGTTVPMPAVLPHLSGSPGSVRWPGAAVGAHTEEILRDVLHLSAEQQAALIADGVVGAPPA
jgi:crotonobetainyl-CoA:carnitine CoA-transferase CaiB-like acyl-CoA transferase